MRFIFDYVSCCMMSTPCADHEPSSQVTPATEETRSLVASAATARTEQRRKRVPTRGSSADWRPSLYAISEDNAVAAAAVAMAVKPVRAENSSQRRTQPRPQQQQQTGAPRNVIRCGQSSVRVNAHSRSYSYECSRDPLPMVVPTFSAAPFMF